MEWIESLHDLHRRQRGRFFAAALWVSLLFVLSVVQIDLPALGVLLRETYLFTLIGAPLFVGAFVGFELAAARNRRESKSDANS